MFASWFMLLPCVWVSWTCWFSILCISSVRRSSTPSCRVMSTYPVQSHENFVTRKSGVYCTVGYPTELEECSALGISPQHLLAGTPSDHYSQLATPSLLLYMLALVGPSRCIPKLAPICLLCEWLLRLLLWLLCGGITRYAPSCPARNTVRALSWYERNG